MRESPFLVADEVATRLHCSLRTVHELTRLGRIPHRRLPGSRRCLFREDELAAWEDGAELEVSLLAHGGRIVRPRARVAYSNGSPTPKPAANARQADFAGD
jgi:excisionase family DNA binding protein